MMAPNNSFLRRISVRWLVAAVIVIGAGVPLILFSALEVRGITRLRRDIAEQSQQAADTLAEESANALKVHAIKAISQTLSDKATSVNGFFQDAQGLVLLMVELAAGAWADPAGASGGHLIDAETMRSESARPKDAAEDAVRGCVVSLAAPMIHVPPNVSEEAKRAARGRLSKLALPIRSVLEHDPKLILFTYLATPDGIFLSYPADASLAPEYDPRSREWYRKAASSDKPVWTAPYSDAGTGVMVMTCAAAVRVDGSCVAVVGLDVRLDLFMKEILALASEPQADAALIDSDGNFAVVPPGMDKGAGTPAGIYGSEQVTRMLSGTEEMFSFSHAGVERFAGCKYIPTVGWHMVVTMPQDITLRLSRKIQSHVSAASKQTEKSIDRSVSGAIHRLQGKFAALVCLVAAIAVSVGLIFSRPVRLLVRMAGRVARGEFEARAPALVTSEFDALATSFNQMAEELANYTERVTREAAERERIATELAAAHEIQESFICTEFPKIPGAEVHAIWEPARETAGDFYDILELPDGRIAMLMADVSGKGLGAAVFMAMARSVLRTIAQVVDKPDEALRRANLAILEQNEATMFVTAVFAIYDPSTGGLQLADAGHTWPLVSRSGECVEMEFNGGMPLGVAEEDYYETVEIALSPGDSVVFYTDGITEAFNTEGDAFEVERFLEVYKKIHDRPAEAVCQEVLGAVRAWSAGRSQSDDIAVLVLSRKVNE